MLSERTVGRSELLALLQRRFVSAATSKNRPHTLLIGPRGAGKTHMVDVALHRVAQQVDVNGRLAVIRLDEDVVGITRYLDVLQEVLRRLGGPQISGQRAGRSPQPEADVATALGDRVLVLVIENLDRVFRALGEAGQQDLRSWVETSGQVMVLATSPLLFPGVGDRSLPWYGNFGISHLEDLDIDQGRELLIHLAREAGDVALGEFIASDRGEARLRAINALAGGSPRIWMILSECLTVQLLDDLVPAVEALLEGLVPYYQQLLWDLSGNEQRLVRELADGPHQAATVAELAAACGLEQRTAATTLGRLADLRWVRPEKAPELDQRSSWYRLREPMLRHHFQYRASAAQPLTLIVELLRAWFDPSQRREYLAGAAPASETERLMAAAVDSAAGRSDSAYAERDVGKLVVEARRWLHGADPRSRTPEAGALIDVGVTAVRDGATIAGEVASRRCLDAGTARVAESLVKAAENQEPGRLEADRVGDLLRLAAGSTSGRTHAVLELISACWDGEGESFSARDRLQSLEAQLRSDRDDHLRLHVQQEAAYWTGVAGDAAAARDQFAALVPMHDRVLGSKQRDTLRTRHELAYWTGVARNPAAACDLAAELLADLDGQPEREEESRAARAILQMNAIQLLTVHEARRDPDVGDIADLGLAATLQAAAAGSAEALVRLPAELVQIVYALRAGTAPPSP